MRTASSFLMAALVACASAVTALADINQGASNRTLKIRVAVAPLDWNQREYIDNWFIPIEFRNAINEKLTKKLLDTGRFIVLERDEMEAILQEKVIKEENTGESQRGKNIPAQALVRGRITDFTMARRGSRGGINLPGGLGRVGGSSVQAETGINIRIFNVDTSEVIASEDSKGTASSNSFNFTGGGSLNFLDFGSFEKSPLGNAMTKAIDGAVEKIVKRLSDVAWSALVADWDADAKEMTLNAGSDAGVKVGDVFEVLKTGRVIRDPETNEVISVRRTVVGKVRITEVEKRVAIAVPVEGTEFKAGDIIREIRI